MEQASPGNETVWSARLLIVDGMALVYRSFFGIRGLTTKDGRPTNALFGFVRGLERLRTNWSPTHVLVVFDGGLPAERTALLADYKAQRVAMPDEMRVQLPPIAEFLGLAGVSRLRVEGEEADDLMASASAWAESRGAEALLATSDKDLFQVVSKRSRIVPLGQQGGAMGPREVEEKTGVRPDQVVDWLALAGDASDHIPGVTGVGPKTAAKWLREYGTIDRLLKMAGQLKPDRLARALWTERDLVARNRKLIRLRKNLAIPFEWEALAWGISGDLAGLDRFFQEYEFSGGTSRPT